MKIPGRYLSLPYGVKLRGLSGCRWTIAFCLLMAIVSPAQTLNTLVSFAGVKGSSPQSSLVQGADGAFYGTTILGGNNNCVSGCGTVFKVTSLGALTPLYIFCRQANCPDGNSPAAGLLLASDGNFYGTTSGDDPSDPGNGSFGTVFKMSPGGSLTTLHDFMTGCGITCPNGATLAGGLVQGSDGNFYGTTEYQGIINCIQGCGTIFKITPAGSLSTLHSFSGADGGHPVAGLVQGTDGNFYGTTSAGGSSANCNGGCGTVFKMSPSGSLIWTYSFKQTVDGAAPVAALVQSTDGNFYGTTSGGLFGKGTVFKITPGGSLTTLHNFNG
ncbi:MAG TPA: choice-of-anchor tandem repeat GloVer-containing protein, partial [Terriglobales bacterium]